MIQTTLFFILGFLSAGLLALMVAPAIWRRAVVLTRRRVEASIPMTLDQIQADKDRLRAEFAMSTRRLEMSEKASREKAANQFIEINRNQDELKRIGRERDEKQQVIGKLEGDIEATRAELSKRDEQAQRLFERLAEAERELEKRGLEIENLGRMYDEASFSASGRQIEMVAQENRIEQLSDDLSKLRGERKEADRRVREIAAENKTLKEAQRNDQRKISGLEKRVERLMAELSDREEKLDRRERELARLRGTEPADNGDPDLNERLESRLATLTRENKKLRAELDEAQGSTLAEQDEERTAEAVLREQIQELAAEVVHLTAMLDEPDSPIRTALEKASSDGGAGKSEVLSLADRIRALQDAAKN
ncbi:hypothetical protein [Mesorhizobium sp. CAU 1732]|uniref:hypothetical protein n=1 Tax=Mesorhizobium sp. CAU 1732 TaxID=3140358 RepID=UPI003261146E